MKKWVKKSYKKCSKYLGPNHDGNIGGQLIIESLQDTVTGSNDGFGFNMSYTFGGKDPVSNKPKDSKSEPGKPEHTGTETPKPLKPNDNAVTVGGSIT